MRPARLAPWFLVLALPAAALGGCGSSTSSTTPSQGQAPPPPPAGSAATKTHRDSGGGSAQFEVKGGDNSIQEFGEEGSESEMREAALALHGFLDSRAEGDFKAACSYLDAASGESLRQLAATSNGPQAAACPQLLATLSKGVPASALTEAAQADVGSLRLEGDRAFLIYRGAQGATYAIAMTREDGEWKVAGLSGTPLG